MNYWEIMAIFIAPIFGFIILNHRYNYNLKGCVLNYLNILILSNLISNLIIYITREYYYLYFSPSFFIKYCIANIVLSVFIALIEIIIKENIKVELKIKNEKK